MRFVRTDLYCFLACVKCVLFLRFVFCLVLSRSNASIFAASKPTPGAVLVTGTETCCVGAIVVRPESLPRSTTRSTTRALVFGDEALVFGDAALVFFGEGLGFVTFLPGIETPVGALFVSVGFRTLTAGIDTPLGGLRVICRRFLPAIETPLGPVRVSFRGAGTPSIGTVGWRLGC